MFKLEIGKKYVCRNGEVHTLVKHPFHDDLGRIQWGPVHYFSYFLNKPGSPHLVFDFTENGLDILAEYVEKKEKKPRKTSSPYKKLLTAKHGDVFVLKGERFEVSVSFLADEIYLSSLDRRNDDDYPWIHVRKEGGVAVFGRQGLIDLLRSGKYKVS